MAEVKHEVEPENIAEEVPQYTPSVYLEVSKEQLDLLEVGKNISMKIQGKVKSLEANEQDKANNRYSINLELKAVSIFDDDNEFSKLAEDDD